MVLRGFREVFGGSGKNAILHIWRAAAVNAQPPRYAQIILFMKESQMENLRGKSFLKIKDLDRFLNASYAPILMPDKRRLLGSRSSKNPPKHHDWGNAEVRRTESAFSMS